MVSKTKSFKRLVSVVEFVVQLAVCLWSSKVRLFRQPVIAKTLKCIVIVSIYSCFDLPW
jgi:hypothetical protein